MGRHKNDNPPPSLTHTAILSKASTNYLLQVRGSPPPTNSEFGHLAEALINAGLQTRILHSRKQLSAELDLIKSRMEIQDKPKQALTSPGTLLQCHGWNGLQKLYNEFRGKRRPKRIYDVLFHIFLHILSLTIYTMVTQ